MLQATFHIVTWDHGQQPDWADVQRAISCYNQPVITQILQTGDDHSAILISSIAVTQAQASECYARWIAQRL